MLKYKIQHKMPYGKLRKTQYFHQRNNPAYKNINEKTQCCDYENIRQ